MMANYRLRFWKKLFPIITFILGMNFRIWLIQDGITYCRPREVGTIGKLNSSKIITSENSVEHVSSNVKPKDIPQFQGLGHILLERKTTYRPRPTLPIHPDGRCSGCFNWQYPYLMSPPEMFCSSKDKSSKPIDLLVLALSRHQNGQQRDIIRRTWGSYARSGSRIRLLFIFGKYPELNAREESSLQLESVIHGDILQIGVLGTSHNMTFVVFNALRWAGEQCSEARFVVKISDDVYLNIPGVLTLLEMKGNDQLSDVIFGECLRAGGPPLKNTSHENALYELRGSYPYDRYPSYCSGAGMFMSMALMRKLLLELTNIKFPLAHDDVMLGIALRLTDYCPCNIPGFFFFDYRESAWLQMTASIALQGCSKFRDVPYFLGLHLHGLDPIFMEHFRNHQTCLPAKVPPGASVACPRRHQCPEHFYWLPNN